MRAAAMQASSQLKNNDIPMKNNCILMKTKI